MGRTVKMDNQNVLGGLFQNNHFERFDRQNLCKVFVKKYDYAKVVLLGLQTAAANIDSFETMIFFSAPLPVAKTQNTAPL